MNQIVSMVKEKAGISEQQAEKAVQTVTSFLKDKLPASMSSQLDSFMSSGKSSGNTDGNFKDKLGGMFGK